MLRELFFWVTILCMVLLVAATTVMAQDATTQPTARPDRRPRLRSPEVTPDHHVTLRLRAPQAKEVKVWTEWDGKEYPLTRDESGVWSANFGPIEPNVYVYKFTVDGVPTVDPLNRQVRPSGPPASLVEIGGPDSPYALRPVPHGQVHEVYYDSKSLGRQRRMHVYLPPGYDADPARKYPVLYLLHGSGNDDSWWHRLGRAGLILDNLLAEGKARPMLIVMPDGHARSATPTTRPQTRSAGAYWDLFGVPGAFADDLFQDIIPHIETRYHVQPGRDHRAVAGTSMGGTQAAALGVKYPDQFAYVLSFSGGLGFGRDKGLADLVPDTAALNRHFKLFWIGCGQGDNLHRGNLAFIAELEKAGVKHTWHETQGLHTWPEWRTYLHQTLPLLFAPANESGAD